MGDPVTAEDDNADDVLTYTLGGVSNNFVIDRATGQISVAKDAEFSHVIDDDVISVDDTPIVDACEQNTLSP